jgi:hypothetical protein
MLVVMDIPAILFHFMASQFNHLRRKRTLNQALQPTAGWLTETLKDEMKATLVFATGG